MRLILIILLILFSIPIHTYGQERLKTPNSEVEDCIRFLVGEDNNDKLYIPKIDRPYIKFLSTYAIKGDFERKRLVLACSNILHSLVGPAKDIDNNNAGAFYPLAKMVKNKKSGKIEFLPFQKVPFSDTLWYIDIRDFNFTQEAWEKAALIDGYFVTPIVQEQNNGSLRLLSGNAVLRMDWFITQVSDTTRQRDIDDNFDLYTTFLFAQVTPPKTAQEWAKLFSLDFDKTRQIGNEFGTIVTKGKTVARHNRMLFGYNTELGYMYSTYDVKNQQGLRDYFESFFKNPRPGTPPQVFDAGEIFGTNQLGLQVYALNDAKGNLVNFGDPTVVRHLADIHGDIRVRVAHSCFDCHASGPLPAENSHVEYLEGDTDLYFYKKEDRNRVKRVFLDNKFDESIVFNRTRFALAIEKTNGLTPEQNLEAYLDSIREYCKDVDLERAAYECGVTQEEFKEKVIRGRFGFRLKKLVENKEAIPIDIWESRGKDGIPGQFQQAMILINGLTKIENEKEIVKAEVKIEAKPQPIQEIQPVVEVRPEEPIPQNSEVVKEKLIVTEDTIFYVNQKNSGIIPKGTVIDTFEIRPDWVKINIDGKIGFVDAKKVIKQ